MCKNFNKKKYKLTKPPLHSVDLSKEQANFYKSYYPPERGFNAPLFDKLLAINERQSLVELIQVEQQLLESRIKYETESNLQITNEDKLLSYQIVSNCLEGKSIAKTFFPLKEIQKQLSKCQILINSSA